LSDPEATLWFDRLSDKTNDWVSAEGVILKIKK